jgi:hypothetical protein
MRIPDSMSARPDREWVDTAVELLPDDVMATQAEKWLVAEIIGLRAQLADAALALDEIERKPYRAEEVTARYRRETL